jgi:hypothetical protein
MAGIYRSGPVAPSSEDRKTGQYARTNDETVKAEIDRLTAELAKLPREFRAK